MLKKLLFLVMAGGVLCLPIASVQAFTIHVPTDLYYYDSTKAYEGVTIFSPISSTAGTGTVAPLSASNPDWTFMIDMYGRLVHKWPSPNYTVMYGTVLENGDLLRGVIPPANTTLDPHALLFAGGGVLEECNWNGKIVFSYNAFTTDPNGVVFRQSHDFQRIWNKKLGAYTTLFVAGQQMTQAQGLAMGAMAIPANGWSVNTSQGIVPTPGPHVTPPHYSGISVST
jgi:hypothetical protein